MDCIICGRKIVNENNRLQKQVKEFLKSNGELDLKHQWILQWKICYDCSERYTNEKLLFSTEIQQKIDELDKRKKQHKEVLRYNREPDHSQVAHAYYIDKYINYATDKAEEKGVSVVERPNLRNPHQYSSDYIKYVERNESIAVFILRNLVDTINTRGKWIDILLMEKQFLSHYDADFSFIIVELFQQTKKPIYPKKMKQETSSEYRNRKAYITWQTATLDINSQRTQGIKGDIFIVLPCLKNEHVGMYDKHYIAWDNDHRHYKRVQNSNKYVNIIKPPKWGYSIQASKKINHHQLGYIKNNLYQITRKINKKQSVTLSMFEPQTKKNKK